VGTRAGLHPNQTSRLLAEERQQPAARQAALDDNRPSSINAVYLKNRLPKIQSDCHR
jgi:hypothetical protein